MTEEEEEEKAKVRKVLRKEGKGDDAHTRARTLPPTWSSFLIVLPINLVRLEPACQPSRFSQLYRVRHLLWDSGQSGTQGISLIIQREWREKFLSVMS